ncbi:MAG: hypothetical protein U0105_09645 [Candidatus Obscuribacterales bacterium]
MYTKIPQVSGLHSTINKWHAIKRNVANITASHGVDASELLATIDHKIETLQEELALYETLRPLGQYRGYDGSEESTPDIGPFAVLAAAEYLPACLTEGRLILGWTQPVLGARVGLTKAQVCEKERGMYAKTNFSTVLLVARALSDEYQSRREKRVSSGKNSKCAD